MRYFFVHTQNTQATHNSRETWKVWLNVKGVNLHSKGEETGGEGKEGKGREGKARL